VINKRHLNKDKFKKRNKSSSSYSNKSFGKKNLNEIKVVSTNISKDKEPAESKKQNKPNFVRSSKESNYNNKIEKPDKRYSRPRNLSKDFNKKDTKNDNIRKAALKSQFIQYKINIADKKKCSKCNRTIEEMDSSIKDDKNNKVYHFNCVLSEIKKDNSIESKQRIVYLGSGAFGVIEDLDPSSNNHKFEIKKKIQFIDNS
jgi:hypothetical protein